MNNLISNKIVIGTANFGKRYGIRKVKNNNPKKILDYLRKKKIYGSYKQIINFLHKNPKLNLYNRQYSKAYYKTKIKKYI